eukprot:5280975-Pyramimonas_sp.AAC.1
MSEAASGSMAEENFMKAMPWTSPSAEVSWGSGPKAPHNTFDAHSFTSSAPANDCRPTATGVLFFSALSLALMGSESFSVAISRSKNSELHTNRGVHSAIRPES